MGYDAERAADLADMYEAGLINLDGSPNDESGRGYSLTGPLADSFDTPDEFDTAEPQPEPVKKTDPLRPEAVRGRYVLPNPKTGKTRSWQRVTNFVKLSDDTYHLELWKQRNVAKGIALMAGERDGFLDDLATRDVKRDKDRLNRICEKAQEAADAWKMADEGTALHTSTELVDAAGGDLLTASARHRGRMAQYRRALALHGLSVVPELIERVTASTRYEVAGKFDRVLRAWDGSYVIADLKTGDSLDLSFPSIAAQLACYEDGVNNTGIFNGQRYDTDVKVRTDYGLVIHLPSTRGGVEIYMVDLKQGHAINAVNLKVREIRRVKAQDVASAYAQVQRTPDMVHSYWTERLNACHTYDELVGVAKQAKAEGEWTDRLGGVARRLAEELPPVF